MLIADDLYLLKDGVEWSLLFVTFFCIKVSLIVTVLYSNFIFSSLWPFKKGMIFAVILFEKQ